jgi:hypothetical protein
MLLKEVKAKLAQEPFVPLRVITVDGTVHEIPFKGTATILPKHLLIMKGVESATSRRATGYANLGCDQIAHIEPVPQRRARRNAS